ncbi:MAG TPA: exodeoxyribonuclease VII small subunit, partial [Chthoniobacteraceae bacterium]|nr:exodeoxyribonuclease VII small subunit [Chthoniobacteraceae bacterium]
ERLEGIVEEMEGDRLPLEQLLERYSEGTGLLKVCQEKLDAAEKKIEIITRSASGKLQLAPFDPAAAAPGPAPAPSASRKSEPDPDEVSLF